MAANTNININISTNTMEEKSSDGSNNNSSSTTTNNNTTTNNTTTNNNTTTTRYRCLVVDSGPIIKHAGIRNLFGKAELYITVPGVMDEIRDAKARAHLDQWPMELQVKSPTPESIQQIIAFSKQTGDYASLSKVDLEVMALALDMEKEGCANSNSNNNNNMEHIRSSPKRMIGLGNIQSLKNQTNTEANTNTEAASEEQTEAEKPSTASANGPQPSAKSSSPSQTSIPTPASALREQPGNQQDGISNKSNSNKHETTNIPTTKTAPVAKSWAALVNPSAASTTLPKVDLSAPVVPVLLSSSTTTTTTTPSQKDGGQFGDAEDEEDDNHLEQTSGKQQQQQQQPDVQAELESAFPSLAAAATVPYEGSDDENDEENENNDGDKLETENENEKQPLKPTDQQLLLEKKMQALQPISKSGKLYNSFRKYGKLMKPKPATSEVTTKKEETNNEGDGDDVDGAKKQPEPQKTDDETNQQQSRILGGGATMASSDMGWDEDDGEGWITCKSDIMAASANGSLGGPQKKNGDGPSGPVGPPQSDRTACTTTDFAMQNVLLQMGMALLSVDGVQIRRVKSWVYRCGACFKIHTDAEFLGMKRLFCSHCGSDMMQRIAASVDGKTGRLKLHLSKKYKHNLRGTKFSLPKPGSGNRFQGDLLLREDQLLTGAWNQKVKIRTGGQSRANAQSIFGKDLASNVGCETKLVSTDDVRVAFGRRNPNGAKGRERRGKKKKSSDRACGLRRY